MSAWPDSSFVLLRRYVAQLDYRGPRSRRPCASVLRRFQRFVIEYAATPVLSRTVIEAWLRAETRVSPLPMVIRRAQIVDTFLDWLVSAGLLPANPFAQLRAACRPRGTRSLVPALLSEDPDAALARLRGLPQYGSHLGSLLRDHIARMQTLGYKCEAGRFLRFDRFVQRRLGAEAEPFPALVLAHAADGNSPAVQYERLKLGRVLGQSLQRMEPGAPTPPPHDRVLKRSVLRQYRRPHIFSTDEIQRLLHTAQTFTSPHAPLRPATLHAMVVIGYCAGLRMGEIVQLRLRDLRLEEGSLEIRETKFFKSRRLPLRPSVLSGLKDYLVVRDHAGLSQLPDTPLFCHAKGGYAYVTAEHLLRRVIRAAGLKPAPGRRGPRVHDLRHTFVVHRMLEWYRQGINPQARLPYLSTYLGHRDIHSTLIYLTITQELLGLANERFRTLGASLLAATEGQTHDHDAVVPAPAAGVLSQLAGPPAGRFGQHRPCVPGHLATVPAIRREAPAARCGRACLR